MYWPVELRPAFDALFDIDDAMGAVVVQSTQPALGAIKLAWWRERLEELDECKVPAEPRLQAAAEELLPRGISGAELAGLEAGWATLLEEEPDFSLIALRGAVLLQSGAQLLETKDQFLANAGALFALGTAARMGHGPPQDVIVALATPLRGHAVPWHLRKLTALARLAVRDLRRIKPFEPEGSGARAVQALLHLWSGRIC